MAFHGAIHQLFDMSYVDGGCVGPIPEGTMYDDTMGCYLTNYAIGLVAAVGALMMLVSTSSDSTDKVFALIFFLGKGIGYVIAGVLHHVIHTQAESGKQEIWWKTAFLFTSFGTMGICLLAVKKLAEKFEALQGCIGILYGLVVAVMGGVMIYIAVTSDMLVAGLSSLAGKLFMLIVVSIRCECLAAFGVIMLIVGLLTQVLLAPTCGDAGYEVCWKDCVLPAPNFNHNALFHALFAIGILILAFALPKQGSKYTPME